MLNRCMAGEECRGGQEWTVPGTKQKLSVQVRRLERNGLCVGAMVVLNDLTEEYILRERQNNLERAKFWNELASAISHEVRNPLDAISTFAQLLPERYADEEFRDQFQELVTKEVGRLNDMIGQLDEYANPVTLCFSNVDVGDLLDAAVLSARQDFGGYSHPVSVDLQGGLPLVRGDASMLVDAVARLLLNAFSAVHDMASPRVAVRAVRGEIGIARLAVVLEIIDNGCGISEELLPQVFSPFCTTKARGIGLGLPIVRRTMIDHSGLISIDSGKNGTTVRLTLPAVAS
jgi:nitrogen-specific signal transduction histidine kinase